jgi:hypothetical protein
VNKNNHSFKLFLLIFSFFFAAAIDLLQAERNNCYMIKKGKRKFIKCDCNCTTDPKADLSDKCCSLCGHNLVNSNVPTDNTSSASSSVTIVNENPTGLTPVQPIYGYPAPVVVEPAPIFSLGLGFGGGWGHHRSGGWNHRVGGHRGGGHHRR